MTNHPGPFEGVGVYFTSELHDVTSAGRLSPAGLVSALADLLGYQQHIIEGADGTVEQFIGDCIVAFWAPSDLKVVLPRVTEAAQRIVSRKPPVDGLQYRISIRFSAAELIGAFFGPPTASRFQVIGRARSRAEALPRGTRGTDCVMTDGHTVEAMPPELQCMFTPHALGHRLVVRS